MQNDHFVNLFNSDWTERNLGILKFCKEEADKSVAAFMADYPVTPHHAVIRGVLAWDRLDDLMDKAAKNNLFHGITSHWVDFMGARILELHGKYTSLTAKHILSRDEHPADSRRSYRENNRAKNQKNMELFQEFEASAVDELLHIVFLHGGKEDNFGFLRIYLDINDAPTLTENIMVMVPTETVVEAEAVPLPTVTLKDKAAIAPREPAPTLVPSEADNAGKS